MTPLSEVGPRRVGDEYEFIPISAGIPPEHRSLVHVVNYNDLESVEAVCRRYPVGALITEPVLQNVGVVKPLPGYLAGLRDLARRHGFLLIFDEVKTGFRNGFGGIATAMGVEPDLVVYGKAVASGYPLAVLGGATRSCVCSSRPPRRRGCCWPELTTLIRSSWPPPAPP